MNRKSTIAISLGILSAAVLCVIAGVICYFLAKKNAILLLVGIFMIGMGVFMAVVPLIILLIILLTWLIARKRNK